VIRISGSRAGNALKSLTGKIPVPRQGTLARVRDPRTDEVIDEALSLWFPAPHSETGEDTAELQLHGGRAVIAAVLDALSSIEGLRPAEAGEFTRRAFENGKLDLTAVEGLADLVGAETESQRRQALRHMRGLLGGVAETWRQRLVQALALVEAAIDFSDEGDVPDNLVAPALAIARELEAEIAGALDDGGRGERLRDGVTVAIAGPPNAGKSTLLNRIAKREVAIVSPYAGTTRDVIEVHLDLGGWPVTLLDTAGIRETDNPVESEGVRRALDRAASANLVLWVVDSNADDRTGDSAKPHPALAVPVWLIRNKVDLIQPLNDKSESIAGSSNSSEAALLSNKSLVNLGNRRLVHKSELSSTKSELEFDLSATTGLGFDQFLDQLAVHAEGLLAGAESSLVTRQRHRLALQETQAALRRAVGGQVPVTEDLLAEELRIAAGALGRLTGRVDVEDILDVIFRDFCIGK